MILIESHSFAASALSARGACLNTDAEQLVCSDESLAAGLEDRIGNGTWFHLTPGWPTIVLAGRG